MALHKYKKRIEDCLVFHIDGRKYYDFDDIQAVLGILPEPKDFVKNKVGRPRVSVSVDRAKLKELREGKGLSQQDIAQALGYTDARITQFETGSGTGGGVPLDALKQFADILGVDYQELMVEEC